jgi:hypothetical protein
MIFFIVSFDENVAAASADKIATWTINETPQACIK